MITLKLGKEHFNSDNEYIGETSVDGFNGHIEIAANLGYVRFKCIVSTGRILALAGSGIEAGWGIKAGLGIEAGSGIEAGLGINCAKQLFSGLRIFAGLCLWRKPTNCELKITCGKLAGGEVHYGELCEIGMVDEAEKSEHCEGKVVEVDGVKYKLTAI